MSIDSRNHVIVQVKNNQQPLFEDCVLTNNIMKPDDQFIAPVEKGHNGIEHRSAFIFKEFFTIDSDWNYAKELVIIRRIQQVYSTKTRKWNEAQETSFYISTTSFGIKRAKVKIGLANFTYNMKRLIFFDKEKVSSRIIASRL